MNPLDGRPTPESKAILNGKLEAGLIPAPPRTAVTVDYPKKGESVVSREYAIRIDACAEGDVEVSIDDEGWLPCRRAAGFWWRDWSGYEAGAHAVAARITSHRGRRNRSERRVFFVE